MCSTGSYVPLVLKFADFKHGLHSALFSAGVLHKHSFLPFSVSTIDPACVLVQCQLSNCFHHWKKLKHSQSQPDKKIINNYNKKNPSIPDNKKNLFKNSCKSREHVGNSFYSHQWPKHTFSLQYLYNIRQESDENIGNTYQGILIWSNTKFSETTL